MGIVPNMPKTRNPADLFAFAFARFLSFCLENVGFHLKLPFAYNGPTCVHIDWLVLTNAVSFRRANLHNPLVSLLKNKKFISKWIQFPFFFRIFPVWKMFCTRLRYQTIEKIIIFRLLDNPCSSRKYDFFTYCRTNCLSPQGPPSKAAILIETYWINAHRRMEEFSFLRRMDELMKWW